MDRSISSEPNELRPSLYPVCVKRKLRSHNTDMKFHSNYRSPAYHRRFQDKAKRTYFTNNDINSNFQPHQTNIKFDSNSNSQMYKKKKKTSTNYSTRNSNYNQSSISRNKSECHPHIRFSSHHCASKASYNLTSKQRHSHDQITTSPSNPISKYPHSQNNPNEKSNNQNPNTFNKKKVSKKCNLNKKPKSKPHGSSSTTSILNNGKSISNSSTQNEQDSFVIDHNLSDSDKIISSNYTSRTNFVFPKTVPDSLKKGGDFERQTRATAPSANPDLSSQECELFTTNKTNSLPLLDSDEKNIWSCSLDISKITNPEGASLNDKDKTQDQCVVLKQDSKSESCSSSPHKSLESDKTTEVKVLLNQSKVLSDQEKSSNKVGMYTRQVKLFRKLELIPTPIQEIDTSLNQPGEEACIDIDKTKLPSPKLDKGCSNPIYHPEMPSYKHNGVSFSCQTPQTEVFSSELNKVISSPHPEIPSTELDKIHSQIPCSIPQKPPNKVNKTFTFPPPQAEMSGIELDKMLNYPSSEMLNPSSSQPEIPSLVDQMSTPSSSQPETPSFVDKMSTPSSSQPEIPCIELDKISIPSSSQPEIPCIELDKMSTPSSQPEIPSLVDKMSIPSSSQPEIPCIELDKMSIPSSSQPEIPCIELDKMLIPSSSQPEIPCIELNKVPSPPSSPSPDKPEISHTELDKFMSVSQQEELSGLPCGQKTIVSSPSQEDKGYEHLIDMVSQVSSFSPNTQQIESPYRPVLEPTKNLNLINDMVPSEANAQPVKVEPSHLHNSPTLGNTNILSVSDLPKELFGSGSFFFQANQSLCHSNFGIPKEFFKCTTSGQPQTGEYQNSPPSASLSSHYQRSSSSVNSKKRPASSLTKNSVHCTNDDDSEECDINTEFHDCFKKLSSMPGNPKDNVNTPIPLSSPTAPFTSTQYTKIPHKLPAFSISPLEKSACGTSLIKDIFTTEDVEDAQLSPVAQISPIPCLSPILKQPENYERVASVVSSTKPPLSPGIGNSNAHKPCRLVDYTLSQEIVSQSQPVSHPAATSNSKQDEVLILNVKKSKYKGKQLQEMPKSLNFAKDVPFGSTHVEKSKVDATNDGFEANVRVILRKVENMLRKKRKSCIKKKIGCWFDIKLEDVINDDIISSVRYRIPLLKFLKKTKDVSVVLQTISEENSGTLKTAPKPLPNPNAEKDNQTKKDEELNEEKRFSNLPAASSNMPVSCGNMSGNRIKNTHQVCYTDETSKKSKSQEKLTSKPVPFSYTDISINSESSQTHQQPQESKNKDCHVAEKKEKRAKRLYAKNETSDSTTNLEQVLPSKDSITSVLEEMKTLCSNLVVLRKNCQLLDADTLSQMRSDVRNLKNILKPVYQGLKLITSASDEKFPIQTYFLNNMTILWASIRTLSTLCKTLEPKVALLDIKKQAREVKHKIKSLKIYVEQNWHNEDSEEDLKRKERKTPATFLGQEVEAEMSPRHSDFQNSPLLKKRKKRNHKIEEDKVDENDGYHVDASPVVTNKENAGKPKRKKKKKFCEPQPQGNDHLLMSEESLEDGQLKGKNEIIQRSEVHYRSRQLTNIRREKWSSTYKSIRLSRKRP